MIKVFHAINPNFGFATEARPDPIWPEGFEHVADVATDSLDEAFEATNNIDTAWVTNDDDGVTPTPIVVARRGCRSTSVGDVCVKDNGSRWLCSPVGWTELAPTAAQG